MKVSYKEPNIETLFNGLRISSIVYSIYLNQKIDIQKASILLDNSKAYGDTRLKIIMVKPKATIGMSKSGYIRSMGTTSINNAQQAINITLYKLLEKGLINEIKITKERIENIVVSGAISEGVDLENIVGYLDNCIYEPEQFPAIMYRPFGKVVILVFSSGKIVIVGAVTIEEINKAYDHLKNKIGET